MCMKLPYTAFYRENVKKSIIGNFCFQESSQFVIIILICQSRLGGTKRHSLYKGACQKQYTRRTHIYTETDTTKHIQEESAKQNITTIILTVKII